MIKDKILVGISGGEFGVQCHVTAYDIKDGKEALAGLLGGARRSNHGRSREDHLARQAGR